MIETFFATLTPMLTLFTCMAVGFISNKTGILPKNAGQTMSKLITWVFYPALAFVTMARCCTISTISAHVTNILFSIVGVSISALLTFALVGLFAKRGAPEWGVYAYALTFANSGYMGDPLVQALFGDVALSYYKMYTIPISIFIYTWGLSVLVPTRSASRLDKVKKIFNAPMIGMLLGIAAGLSGLGELIPDFVLGALDALKACMGPTAMLLAGFTVAEYSVKNILTNKKLYALCGFRLVIIPCIIVASLYGVKCAVNTIFDLSVSNDFLYLALFATATALGLNTIVFPEAYGGDPEPGAGMTMISHTMCIITIPLLYALATLIFGAPSF